MSMHNSVDRYWKPAEMAPLDIAVQVQVTDASGVLFVLPFPCKLTAEGWVKASAGTPLAVTPTRWKLHVETLPSKRAWARRWRKSSIRRMATEPAKAVPQPTPPLRVQAIGGAKINEP
jgi:hypothetical protein